jgi:hypothetical protein
MIALLALIFAVTIFNMLGVKPPPHRGARSAGIRAGYALRRMKRGKFW